MEITVLGLGYVGAVAAACLADSGNKVVVVDINQTKISQLNAGGSPVMEAGLDELIADNVRDGRLSATDDLACAVSDSEVTIICVGTPSTSCGAMSRWLISTGSSSRSARRCALADDWRLVMLSSTVPPGTTQNRVVPAPGGHPGGKCGQRFGVAFSPEFLREGTAIEDYRARPGPLAAPTSARSTAQAAVLLAPYAQRIYCGQPAGGGDGEAGR